MVSFLFIVVFFVVVADWGAENYCCLLDSYLFFDTVRPYWVFTLKIYIITSSIKTTEWYALT